MRSHSGPWDPGASRVQRVMLGLAVDQPEDVAAVIISDDNETSFPIDMPQAVSTLKVEPVWGQKQPLEDRSPHSSPPKKWATEEKEESPPPREAVLP